MELIINKATYTLKEMNAPRRQFFVDNVLSHYNYEAKDFDSFIKLIQDELLNKYQITKSILQVKQDFFKQFSLKLHLTIWQFLNPRDKKELKTADNLDIEQVELQKFIETNCAKIKEYSEYVKTIPSDGIVEDINAIYSYIASTYGWSLNDIKEMDELELLYCLEQAIILNKKKNIEDVNIQSLAGSYVSGSKKAKSQIDKMSSQLKNEILEKQLQKNNPTLQMKNELTKEQLRQIMEGKDVS